MTTMAKTARKAWDLRTVEKRIGAPEHVQAAARVRHSHSHSHSDSDYDQGKG